MRSHPKKRQVVQADAAPRGESSYINVKVNKIKLATLLPSPIIISPVQEDL